ncbi:MAG: hypothetical protein J6S91_11250, partial [Treponema sp.]|nr:hypothetical protein [Treponema sp.]
EEAPKLEGKLPGGYVNSLDDLPWEYACTLNPVDLEVLNVYGVSSYVELMNPNPRPNPGWYPLWQSNPNPENGGFEEDVALAGNRMEDVQRKYLPKLIMCKPSEFDKLWDEYVAEMKPLTDVYNSYMQEQLDSRVEFFGGE